MFEEKVKKWSAKVSYVSRIASFVVLVILVADIISSKFFNGSITGAKAFTEMLMILMVYFAMPLVTAERTHILIDLIKYPPVMLKILDLLHYLLGTVLCGLLTWRTTIFVMETIRNHKIMIGTEGWLNFPLWIVALFVPLGYLVTALIYLMQLVIEVRKPIDKKGAPSDAPAETEETEQTDP